MELLSKWIWVVVILAIVLLLVHPRSQAQNVIGSLSQANIGAIKALTGNA